MQFSFRARWTVFSINPLLKSIEFPSSLLQYRVMSLTLQILTGHRYGESLVLESSTSVGRLADVSFDDVKMSKIHALFEMDRFAGWVIKDQESKNGVMVNGLPIDSHFLQESDIIEIGSTQLRVTAVSSMSSVSWKPQLNQILIDAYDSVRNNPFSVYPFRNIPALNFIQGLQAGEKYVLEYGPRGAGGESEDIQLFEPFCPDLAFELSADHEGVWFKTKYPSIVLINETETTQKLLKKGDRIRIHKTIIEVDFLNL